MAPAVEDADVAPDAAVSFDAAALDATRMDAAGRDVTSSDVGLDHAFESDVDEADSALVDGTDDIAADSGADSAGDASQDGSLDAALDAPSDAERDVGFEVVLDAAPDAVVDAAPEAAPDVAHDAPSLDADAMEGRDAAEDTTVTLDVGPDVVCGPAESLCGERCVNVLSDLAHCGACSAACPALANATSRCAAGRCALDACAVGFADCDGAPSNGCEADLRASASHCGACGVTCGAIANGTATCAAGRCLAATCERGYRAVGARCIAEGGVRPLAPQSLANTSLLRPTLRFVLPTHADGAVVQLCYDRACTMEIARLYVTGSSARPAANLPRTRPVFWRARARVGVEEDYEYGPTWLFHTPAADASSGVDTSSHPHVDVNGDGYDDVVVGASNAMAAGLATAGYVQVFHGTNVGLALPAARTINGAAVGQQLGTTVSGAGDVNGDGFGDVLIGAPRSTVSGRYETGTVGLYLGSAAGLSMSPSTVIAGVAANDNYGTGISGAGDVNGDGYADTIIGVPNSQTASSAAGGQAFVHYGSRAGLALAGATRFEGVAQERIGWAVTGGADFNGDGLADVAYGAPWAHAGGRATSGQVYIALGAPSGVSPARVAIIEGTTAGDRFGSSIATVDVNGDGFSDLIAGAPFATRAGFFAAGEASVQLGGAVGVSTARSWVYNGTAAGSGAGSVVSAAGDINGDGFSEVLVASPGVTVGGRMFAGQVRLFASSASGVAAVATHVFEGAAQERLASALAWAGDVNRDGFDDFLIGAHYASPGGREFAGEARLYQGSAAGLVLPAATVIAGSRMYDYLGTSVASVVVRRAPRSCRR